MLMADTFAIFFSVVGAILGHLGLWLLCRGIFPKTTKLAGDAARRGILLPLAIGVPMTIATILVTALVSSVLGGVGQALAIFGVASWVL